MLIFLLVIGGVVGWFTLSTIVYHILFKVYKINDGDNPLPYLAVGISPIGFLAVVGLGLGRIMSEKINDIFKDSIDKIKEKRRW